jgi:hypothetical protein
MRFLTIAGIILLGGPLMASSISYVTTDSSAGGSSNNYDSVTGLNQHVGLCFAQGSNTIVVPCATLESTPSSNILGLTSASVSLSAQSFDPQNGVSGSDNASAYANLASGTLGVSAAGLPCSPTTPLCADGGTAVAEMQDALTFTNTTGAVQDITLSWTFDGTVTPNGSDGRYSVTSLFCFGAGVTCGGNPNSQPHGPISFSLFEFENSDGTVTTTQPSADWVTTSIIPGSNGTSETFEGTFAVPNGVSTDSLNAYLDIFCQMETCDFSHTGQFSIGALPDGVSFTSSCCTWPPSRPPLWSGAPAGYAIVTDRSVHKTRSV